MTDKSYLIWSVYFIGLLNDLVERSKYGYVPISQYEQLVVSGTGFQGIIYDDSHIDESESSDILKYYEVASKHNVEWEDFCDGNGIRIYVVHDISINSFYVWMIVRDSGLAAYITISDGRFTVS